MKVFVRALPFIVFGTFAASPVVAREAPVAAIETTPLSDQQLAQLTGKFLLPNGVELALSVTSDTVVNGQLVLRTVLTIDNGSKLSVYGRQPGAPTVSYAASAAPASAGAGVTVTLDRQSGLQSVTPNLASAAHAPIVSVTDGRTAEALGLTALPVTPGSDAVTTADGAVTAAAVPSGTLITLLGDHFAVSNLVGRSVATALVNTANDRQFDTVTNIAVDLKNVTPYQVGSAQMRVEALALDATRGMMR